MANVVNVVFGKLAENVLQTALARVGRSEDAVVFPDDLSCGPLNPLGESREIWMRENLHLLPNEWGVFPRRLTNFFDAPKLRQSKIICWVCRHSVYEFCGFDQCIDQLEGDLYYIDTMTAAQFERDGNTTEDFPPRLAHISSEIAVHFIGTEVPLSASLHAEQLKEWERLRTENAPLRTIGPQGVESVSLSHFDPLLRAFADTKWQPAQWVVTRAAVEANNDNFFRVDMMILAGRLRELVKQGEILADRDVMHNDMNIRLP